MRSAEGTERGRGRWAPWIAVLLVLLATPSRALAWSDLGHRIICEIAFREVHQETRQRISELIRHDAEFRRFSDACTWPDHPRSRPTEHYVNLPRDATGIGTDPCPLADTCVITAIAADQKVLASPAAAEGERLAALKYLGHWVADVHQPLHVSFGDDRGGTAINTIGACIGSLHGTWDGCLVESALAGDVASIATELRNDITPAQRAEWAASSPIDWANESFALVTSPFFGYCVRTPPACWYDSSNPALDPGEPLKTVLVDQVYVEAAAAIIRERLKRAAVRLARLLDQALGN